MDNVNRTWFGMVDMNDQKNVDRISILAKKFGLSETDFDVKIYQGYSCLQLKHKNIKYIYDVIIVYPCIGKMELQLLIGKYAKNNYNYFPYKNQDQKQVVFKTSDYYDVFKYLFGNQEIL